MKVRPYFLLSLLFISFPVFSWPDAPISNVSCTGQVCDALGADLKSQLTELPYQFQVQYLEKALQAMTYANGTTNAFSGITGMGTINKFQIGTGFNASVYKDGTVDFKYRDVNVKKLPLAGFSIAPNLMAGVNLGWILGQGSRDEGSSFLNRFNLYVKGSSLRIRSSDLKAMVPSTFEYNGSFSFTQMGIMLRFDMIKPSNQGLVFRFQGVNLGIGYSRMNISGQVDNDKRSNTTFNVGEFQGSWIADTHFLYGAKMNSIPIDFRTGFLLFRTLTIFVGTGINKSEGSTRMEISRAGSLKLSVDPLSVYNYSSLTPSLTASDIPSPEGYFSVALSSKDVSKFTHAFLVGGFEIDLWKLKLLVEGLVSEHAASASFGVKLDF